MPDDSGPYTSPENAKLTPFSLYYAPLRQNPLTNPEAHLAAPTGVYTLAHKLPSCVTTFIAKSRSKPNIFIVFDCNLGSVLVFMPAHICVSSLAVLFFLTHFQITKLLDGGIMLDHCKSSVSSSLYLMSIIPERFVIYKTFFRNVTGTFVFPPALEYSSGRLEWEASLNNNNFINLGNGFLVSANLAKAQEGLASHSANLAEPFWKTFYRPFSKMSRMKRGNYSEFLENVSKHGLDSLYLDYGIEIIELLRNKSSISEKDLQNYKVKEYPALHMKIKDRSIFTTPAPFGGPQLLSAAQMLFNTKVDSSTKESDFYHYIIEAIQRSYPGYLKLDNTMSKSQENATTEYLKEAVDSSPLPIVKTATDTSIPILPPQASSVVTVLDAVDNYVVAVLGLGSEFGSQVMSNHGILYNNHLANIFNHNHASERNHSPGTRPLTPYTPFIVTDARQVCGQRALLGSGEVDAALQVLSQIMFRGSNLTQAIKRPRIIIKPNQDEIFVHDVGDAARLSGSTRNALRRMGHTFSHQTRAETSINGVAKRKDTVVSWADVRGGGRAFHLKVAGSEDDVIESDGMTRSFEDSTTETSDINHHDVETNMTHPLSQNGHLTHLTLDNVSLGEYSSSPIVSGISSERLSKIGTVIPYSSHISADGSSRASAVINSYSEQISPITPFVTSVSNGDSSLSENLNIQSANGETTGGSILSQGTISQYRKGAIINKNSESNEESLSPLAVHISPDGSSRSSVKDRIANINFGTNTKVDAGILSAGIVSNDPSLVRE
ncbi:unnamed protein product, partial [Meganyctiphanes norvegica]